MKNIEKYNDIFKKVFLVQNDILNEEFTILNIDKWDSLTHITLIEELEFAFDIIFESNDIIHYGGYINGLKILKKYGVDFEG